MEFTRAKDFRFFFSANALFTFFMINSDRHNIDVIQPIHVLLLGTVPPLTMKGLGLWFPRGRSADCWTLHTSLNCFVNICRTPLHVFLHRKLMVNYKFNFTHIFRSSVRVTVCLPLSSHGFIQKNKNKVVVTGSRLHKITNTF